ncbi:MAG TPA: DUF3293 domain-containing protein [Xanthomonadales bacterium]|nr:DUF3293 domain-containing protein [Xanthomonadales bacterium]
MTAIPPQELLAEYLRAEYAFEHAGREIRVHVGERMPVLSGWPENLPFALLTAWNPRSVPTPSDVNVAAQARLVAELERAGARVVDAVGRNAESSWVEPSLLAPGLAVEDADRLARAYGQNAILAGRLGAQIVLRVYRPEWRREVVDHPFVEWVTFDAR